MYRWFRPVLFLLPAELAHRLGMWVVRCWGRFGWGRRRWKKRLADLPELGCDRFGLRFPSPLGLAAGLDKRGDAAAGLFGLGFGFVEVGTVTPRPQPGNPEPRLFRAVRDEAVINRMGFNNPGAAAAARNLERSFAGRERPGPVGVNLGKNKLTAEADALADYLMAARAVRGVADYLVVNVSSPNTPGLRDLQRTELLRPLLAAVKAEVPERPLLLKFAPDLADEDLFGLCDVAREVGLAGLIATNTTLWRPSDEGVYREAGGLSGRPLAERARRSLQLAYRRLGGSVPIFGVGGLSTPEDLLSRLEEGACLVQAYTSLIYGGPGWPGATTLALAHLLRRAGYRSVDEAVGRRAV